MTHAPAYSRPQIALHWLTAVLVVAAWLTSGGAEQALRPDSTTTGTPLHVWLGIGVLLATLARLVLRWQHGAPSPAGGASNPAARWGHRLLYVLLIAVPLMGMTLWFGGYRPPIGLHGPAGTLLLILAGGHSMFALWHHSIRRDDTLRRMLRP